MSRRFALVLAVLAAACSSVSSATPETTHPAPATNPPLTTMPVTTTPPTTTTTSAIPAPTTTTPPVDTGPGPSGVETFVPAEVEGAPVAVLVHGGGWVGGAPSSTASLGRALAERGMLVFNASYRTLLLGGGYPDTFDDIACAVRYARQRADEMGATGDLTLVGHSAGAHLSVAVALTEDHFGGDCRWPGSSVPDRWVGLAGIYRIDAVAPVMDRLLGGDRTNASEAWLAADPFEHLDAAADIEMVLIHGATDEIVSSFSSEELVMALEELGQTATFDLVDGGHMDVINPGFVADLIAP